MVGYRLERAVSRDTTGEPAIWGNGQFEVLCEMIGVMTGGRQSVLLGYLERHFPDIRDMEEGYEFEEKEEGLRIVIGGENGMALNLSPHGMSGDQVIGGLDLVLTKALVDDRLTPDQKVAISDGAMAVVHAYQRKEN